MTKNNIRWGKFICCAILLLLVSLCSAAGSWMPVRILFSNGMSREGEIMPIGSMALTIKCSSTERTPIYNVAYTDIVELQQTIEEVQQNRPWMYAESGKNIRMELGEESYPLLNFSTRLLLTSGAVVNGHVISASFRFREPSTAMSKLFVRRQIKGNPGDDASSLLFPVSIRFTANKPHDAKAISGQIPGVLGTLQDVVAIDLKRNIVIRATCQTDGNFVFPAMLDGEYEIYGLTSTCLLAGFAGNHSIPNELQDAFALADDFFKDRVILRRDGNRTLVWKQRADFYDAEKFLHGGILRHLEVWNWHQADREWKLDSRNIPIRLMQQGGETDRKLYIVQKFSAVKPGTRIQLSENDLSTLLPLPEHKAE